jgi:hypothetical protein
MKTIIHSNSFYYWQLKKQSNFKKRKIDARPFFYFFIRSNGFALPEFVFEVFRIFNLSYLVGHHEFVFIFRFIKWKWFIEIAIKEELC